MNKNNLPIKIILQKTEDIFSNRGGGTPKFFGEVTPQLQAEISNKFESLLKFYNDVFEENENIPAIGKVTVKPEAIAKSHKPDDLCRNCPIIGSEDLNEIYIKVKKKSIQETVKLVMNPPSIKFKANMTAVSDIQPIKANEKITPSLILAAQKDFLSIKNNIKVKIFDFDDDFDNAQIWDYVNRKITSLGLDENCELIAYGEHIKFLKIEVNSYEDIIKIASINGVKSVDFFQEYSLPKDDFSSADLQMLLECEYTDTEVSIGIIDGGISDDNPYLQPYITAREEYVSEVYRNPHHATFIASTIQYGNVLNGINSPTCHRFKFVDIIAMPNGDKKFGPTDSISEYDLMDIIEEVMDKYSHSTKIWNISLGIENKPCSGTMSDLGMFVVI